jgi:hypothetical protein
MEPLEISSWADFKALCIVKKRLPCQYADAGTFYTILGPDFNNIVWRTGIAKTDPKNDDQIDFEANYKDGFNLPMIMNDGRERVYNSVRPFGTRIMYMGRGDNIANNYSVGGGTDFKVVHPAEGGNNPETFYLDWNTIENETYLFTGMVSFKGMVFDEITLISVPRVTVTSVGSNTNFNTYGGYLIIPAAGNGTTVVQPSDMRLVQVLQNEDGSIPAGYWNADYSLSTHEFSNVTPAPAGNGGYNMFAAEVTLTVFALHLYLNGDVNNWIVPPCQEVDQLPHGIRMKASMATVGEDHAWTFAMMMVMYRKRTT